MPEQTPVNGEGWWVADHHKCFSTNDTSIPLEAILHLDLLRTCRLVYHEAVLRPFSSNTFQYSARDGDMGALSKVFEALVPTQARAIRTMRLNIIEARDMISLGAERFKGLQHLDVQISLSRCRSYDDLLVCTFSRGDLRELRTLPMMKSLHLTTELRTNPVDLTDSNIAVLRAWMNDLEGCMSDLNLDVIAD